MDNGQTAFDINEMLGMTKGAAGLLGTRAQRRADDRARVAMKRRSTRAARLPRKADPDQQQFVLEQMTRGVMGEIGTPAMRRNLTRRIIGDVRVMIESEVNNDPAFAISRKASPTSDRTMKAKVKLAREVERRVEAKLVEIHVDPSYAA